MSPDLNERDRIRAAMERILSDTAENSNGALTIVGLAQEAGVPRNALTQRHIDLRNEFYARVREHSGTSQVEGQLRQTITRLQTTIANKNKELAQLRADVPELVRTINVLTLENQELRAAHELDNPTVIPIRPKHRLHPGTSTALDDGRPDHRAGPRQRSGPPRWVGD